MLTLALALPCYFPCPMVIGWGVSLPGYYLSSFVSLAIRLVRLGCVRLLALLILRIFLYFALCACLFAGCPIRWSQACWLLPGGRGSALAGTGTRSVVAASGAKWRWILTLSVRCVGLLGTATTVLPTRHADSVLCGMLPSGNDSFRGRLTPTGRRAKSRCRCLHRQQVLPAWRSLLLLSRRRRSLRWWCHRR